MYIPDSYHKIDGNTVQCGENHLESDGPIHHLQLCDLGQVT